MSCISLRKDCWIKLLESLQILPSFVQVLDDNNGGCGTYVSYAQDGITPEIYRKRPIIVGAPFTSEV